MYKNVYFDKFNNTIHLWEQIKGENFYTEIPWIPYVFIKNSKGNIKDIYGNQVIKKEFKDIEEYIEFNKKIKTYENELKPEIQFIVDRYFNIEDEKIENPILKIHYLDIEVYKEKGFPSPVLAQDPIILISVYDNILNKTITWGLKKYNNKNENLSEYEFRFFNDEKDLLLDYFKFTNTNSPDVISGWNCLNFDLHYIINRCKVLFSGKKIFSKLSPINRVSIWNGKNDENINIDIAGVSILDYLEIYKKFSNVPLERYTLDYVGNYELKKGKVDYSEYENLTELYHNDWNKFVKYNRRDAIIPHKLEEKLNFIKLIQNLSLMTRCPMKFCMKQTSLIEGAILTWLRRNNMCAPIFKGGIAEEFDGGFVKEPQKGKWEWVYSIDIQSSYPSHIIALNMSMETYLGKILDISETEIIKSVIKKEFKSFVMLKNNNEKEEIKGNELKIFNNLLKKVKISIAPNGSIFLNNKKGILARFQKEYFEKRLQYKKMMKENKENRLFYNNLQTSIKLILNSTYGATAVPYSRYYNLNISEAITSCGRNTVKYANNILNNILNNIDNYPDLLETLKV